MGELEHSFSRGGADDEVVGEYVVGAAHGQPDAVLVVLKNVAGHVGVETFHQRDSSVTVVVAVVIFKAVEQIGRRRSHSTY